MTTSTILATLGSILAGGAVAAVTVVGVVNAQTSPNGSSPTSVNDPVAVEYGANG